MKRLFGAEQGFERAMRDELPVLYRVARRMGASPEEAEDAVQTTLMKAYQNWSRFDGRHLRSWLIRILRNERLMTLRSAKPVESLDQEGMPEPFEETLWDEVAWRMQADRILEELELLPEHYRMAVQLCDVEQMSYEEAAEAMEVKVGTVRSRLFRARAMLRQRLEPFTGALERAAL